MKLDVRPLIPLELHALIFETFDALASGEAFELVKNRSPKLLSSQPQAALSGQPSWEYLEEDPEMWRMSIGRVWQRRYRPLRWTWKAFSR